MDKLVFFKALSDKTRLKIIDFLKDGERCACEIVPFTKKSQPNVSLHLKKLEDAGILRSRKQGTKILYRIRDKNLVRILAILDKYLNK